MSNNIVRKGVISVAIAALVGGSVVMGSTAQAEAGTKPSVQACASDNLKAKAKYWDDVLNGRGYAPGTKPSFKVREAQVAQDMANAAKNMKSGSYRVCWGE